jgi:hypothetical protein
MKIFGVFALLIGLGLMIFAGLAYSELNAVATAAKPPSPDSMPLTKIIGPEFFDPDHAAAKPAELARKTLNRIYTIGAASVFSLALGVMLLIKKQTPESRVVGDGESGQADS